MRQMPHTFTKHLPLTLATKLLFIKAIVFSHWGFPVLGLSTYLNASEKTINRQPLLISNCVFLFYIVGVEYGHRTADQFSANNGDSIDTVTIVLKP